MNTDPAFVAVNDKGQTRAWSADEDDGENGPKVLGWLRDGKTVRYATIGEACQAMLDDIKPAQPPDAVREAVGRLEEFAMSGDCFRPSDLPDLRLILDHFKEQCDD